MIEPNRKVENEVKILLKTTNLADLERDILNLVKKYFDQGVKRGRLEEFVELREQGLLKEKT